MSGDYDDDYADSRAPFPGGVKVAGIIWIVFGVLGLISAALNLVAGAAGGGAGAPQAVTGVGCAVLFALVFLMVGIQSVKGTAKDVLGNGIGSIVFAVIYFGVTAMFLAEGAFAGAANPPPGKAGQPPVDVDSIRLIAVISGVVAGFLGLLLLLAGVLALSNRTAYKAWRRAEGLDKTRRQSQRELEDDYDDEDDRPRRRRDEG